MTPPVTDQTQDAPEHPVDRRATPFRPMPSRARVRAARRHAIHRRATRPRPPPSWAGIATIRHRGRRALFEERIESIYLNARHTGSADFDQQPGDDGLWC